MCFCEYHDVDVVGLHVVNDGVYFGWFSESCDIPLANSNFVAFGDFDVMGVFVGVVLWALDVSFKPVCSGGLGGVGVLCRGVVAVSCG